MVTMLQSISSDFICTTANSLLPYCYSDVNVCDSYKIEDITFIMDGYHYIIPSSGYTLTNSDDGHNCTIAVTWDPTLFILGEPFMRTFIT